MDGYTRDALDVFYDAYDGHEVGLGCYVWGVMWIVAAVAGWICVPFSHRVL